jgi:hypothetical protein
MRSGKYASIIIFAVLLALTGIVMADDVQAGSSFGGSVASVVTHLDARFIGTDASAPVSLNYAVSAKGVTLGDGTYVPMTGDISSFFTVHTMGGSDAFGSPSSILEYKEFSSASGWINAFSTSYRYSGVPLV